MDYGTSYEKGLITLKPETNFWHKIKKFMPEISFTRLENLSSLGTPDLLAYNKKGTFFTVELKVAKVNSVKLSPHQISFHVRHPKNSFILISSATAYKDEKLYEGSRCLELAAVACGLKLAAWGSNLFTINLNACSLRLVACSSALVA
jgi:hypothetical protein